MTTEIPSFVSAVLDQANLGHVGDYQLPESQGKKSFVLFSADGTRAIKIRHPDQPRHFFDTEVLTLERTGLFQLQSMDVPYALETGQEHIVMNRLGKTLADKWQSAGPPDAAEITCLGRQVGEFVLEFHDKTNGLIHRDIHFSNLTAPVEPGARYGCLDFDDCGQGTFEQAFIKLAMQTPNIIPAAWERMRELMPGISLDTDQLRQDALAWVETQCGNDPALRLLVDSNIQELQKSSQGLSHGPNHSYQS